MGDQPNAENAPGTRAAEVFCCRFNVHLAADGTVLHADYWRRCRSCNRRSGHLESLLYRRADGANCMSGADCVECRSINALRLEGLGFTITGNDPRMAHIDGGGDGD